MVLRTRRKQTKKYYFSVEGETEKWYLEWLQKQINDSANLCFNVCFDIKVQKDPVAMVKSSVIFGGEDIFHFFDFESSAPCHLKSRNDTFRRLKEANTIKGVNYHPAYSNFCFELWLLLHKKCLRSSFTDRKQYLKEINRVFNKNFENLHQFKHRDNFISVLNTLTFEDFLQAIKNSEAIARDCEDHGRRNQIYGFYFYENNPATSVGAVFKLILKDCGFLFRYKK